MFLLDKVLLEEDCVAEDPVVAIDVATQIVDDWTHAYKITKVTLEFDREVWGWRISLEGEPK